MMQKMCNAGRDLPPAVTHPRRKRVANGVVVCILLVVATFGSLSAEAQELEPRAYRPLPVGLNFVVFSYSYSSGAVVADVTAPIQDLELDASVPSLGFLRTFGLFGRSASFSVGLPFYFLAGSAVVADELISDSRSGAGDIRARVAVNVIGGPALSPPEFAQRPPGRSLGVGLAVTAPTGQYDNTRVINFGANRWAFKPEVGYSSVKGRWIFDFALGFWFFTANTDFLGQTRTQDPIGSFQAHLSYNFPNRMWLALDANYYTGGRTAFDGVDNVDLQQNSRVGLTFSIPLAARHSLKLAAQTGAYTSLGTDFDILQVAYQYRW